ncbi:hypothetical protein KGM_201868B, partial [Danaus plexippus plexippus]
REINRKQFEWRNKLNITLPAVNWLRVEAPRRRRNRRMVPLTRSYFTPPPTDVSKLIFFGVVIKLGPVRGRGGCQAALQLGVAGCGVRLSTGLPSPRNGSVFRRESRSSPVPRRDSVTR